MSRGVRYSLSGFAHADDAQLLGELTDAVASTGIQSTRTTQIETWKTQVALLKQCAYALIEMHEAAKGWQVILEYELPRRQKRPDAILLAEDVILVVEFKVGAMSHDASSRWQVEDYCLNLRDFHGGSSGRAIVPVLCSTATPTVMSSPLISSSCVAPIRLTNANGLASVLLSAYSAQHDPSDRSIDPDTWVDAPYRPTLSVIEAAERLYENHDVREISHSYASNLDATTDLLSEVIREARAQNRRCVCFVTGVPGAGKTLTGLNVVHDPSLRVEGGPSGIFLSGNGPLVKVVREALVLSQQRAGRRRQDSAHEVSTFIQNVHQFLRYHREHPAALPHEHVVVFDEAQRAWDREQMQRKQGVDRSEAAELFDVMDRLDGWAVIIALVGGGQEIFLGEAGLEEWGRAVAVRPDWRVVASPEVVSGGASVSGHRLFTDGVPSGIEFRPEPLAHLSVGVRSFRAQRLAEWVDAVLLLDTEHARSLVPDRREFPLHFTRDLEVAKAWLRARSEPGCGQRAGLIATSEDQRLRAYGLERSSAFRLDYSFEKWFLMPPADVRSSHALEVAASEFECQGLELDWVGLCWGGDLTPSASGSWEYRKFRGSSWNQVRSDSERTYVRNRYRVLLTRARLGMVIWIPPGKASDPTLEPDRFDRVRSLLEAVGVPELREEFEGAEA
ncbi:DUF2075 domain-containing protein [Verminephrobacter eiseniae]|uniref:Schlafen group 3-like DNA/RNA helicase domain-containing protein n=1 Tax=Verminephrobacter eiseniae (strain EF01-2) TaxID=391735 RepID=A1WH43_VEREI|nr:DUF2075 domain-containing protein [Verminephrobacter eiseniae]ABM56950.1 conserved hypothetical protein [Verminephrobacter eiseniae EF01-2]MCW5287293.1 DUF2075 domain-containing protein [Verminephrobacter eiseniae]MCW5305592.1 DUF2075 domain-containing protein [Verminephrobacter eiseniae]MCW8178658.1 DUF2075 domain-containing protein [Verminephrobacter eiseniae]MCW8188601.1 DUF2075 domain-containing protein [Verminephrobacter eiseniae]